MILRIAQTYSITERRIPHNAWLYDKSRNNEMLLHIMYTQCCAFVCGPT